MKVRCILPVIDMSTVDVKPFSPLLIPNEKDQMDTYISYLSYLWCHVPSFIYDKLCSDLANQLNSSPKEVRQGLRNIFMERCSEKEGYYDRR